MEKKRDREQGGILGGVAELFDLPVDVVACPDWSCSGTGSYIWNATRACWLTAIPKSMPTQASAFCEFAENG